MAVSRARVRAFRKATKEEDRAGIDVVVESDVGKPFVQVKSALTAPTARPPGVST